MWTVLQGCICPYEAFPWEQLRGLCWNHPTIWMHRPRWRPLGCGGIMWVPVGQRDSGIRRSKFSHHGVWPGTPGTDTHTSFQGHEEAPISTQSFTACSLATVILSLISILLQFPGMPDVDDDFPLGDPCFRRAYGFQVHTIGAWKRWLLPILHV
eukprot:jgi/Botrbrau1/9921/Bobra.0012s0020.1